MLSRARAGSPTGRTVAVVEWLDPPILAGLWTPDIIVAAGGIPVGPRSGQPGSRTSWEDLVREPPDVVLVSPCSFSVERTFRELEENAEVRTCLGKVRAPLGTFVADEAYFSRPGPRLTEGVALVRALLEGRNPSGAMPVRPFRHRATT